MTTCSPYAITDALTGERLCCTDAQTKRNRKSSERRRIRDAVEDGWRRAGIMRGTRSEACKIECHCEVFTTALEWVRVGHYSDARAGFADAAHWTADSLGGTFCPMNLFLPLLHETNDGDGDATPYVPSEYPLAGLLDAMRDATLAFIPKTRSARA